MCMYYIIGRWASVCVCALLLLPYTIHAFAFRPIQFFSRVFSIRFVFVVVVVVVCVDDIVFEIERELYTHSEEKN